MPQSTLQLTVSKDSEETPLQVKEQLLERLDAAEKRGSFFERFR